MARPPCCPVHPPGHAALILPNEISITRIERLYLTASMRQEHNTVVYYGFLFCLTVVQVPRPGKLQLINIFWIKLVQWAVSIGIMITPPILTSWPDQDY